MATAGQTDDMGRHLADLVEHRRSIGAVGELDILGLGSAVATRVETDHSVAAAQGRRLFVPHPQVGHASMDEQDRLTLTLDLVVDPSTSHLAVSVQHACHGSDSARQANNPHNPSTNPRLHKTGDAHHQVATARDWPNSRTISVVVGDGDLRPDVIAAVLRSGSVMGSSTSSGAEVRLDVHVPMFD